MAECRSARHEPQANNRTHDRDAAGSWLWSNRDYPENSPLIGHNVVDRVVDHEAKKAVFTQRRGGVSPGQASPITSSSQGNGPRLKRTQHLCVLRASARSILSSSVNPIPSPAAALPTHASHCSFQNAAFRPSPQRRAHPGRPRIPTRQRKKGGSLRNRPCHPSSDRDQKSLRYCSLPMKPSLVTAERLITASVWSTLSYFAAGSGWKCSSGSGLIAAAASR